jgi:hypothetical protein
MGLIGNSSLRKSRIAGQLWYNLNIGDKSNWFIEFMSSIVHHLQNRHRSQMTTNKSPTITEFVTNVRNDSQYNELSGLAQVRIG